MKKAIILFLFGVGNISWASAQIPKTNRADSVIQDHMIYEPNKSHADSLSSPQKTNTYKTDSVYTNPKHGTRKQDPDSRKKQSKKTY